MKKKIISLLLVSAMAFGLVGCGSSSSSDKKSENGTEAAGDKIAATTTNKDTDVMYINLASEPDFLDPALNTTVDGGCLAVNSFAGLYTYDAEGTLIPAVAAELPEVSEDGTVYTVKLKETKWSNGDALTAKDFVYSWNRVIDPKTAADYAYLYDVIARDGDKLAVKAVDDYTLEITLVSPCPYFSDLMAFPPFFPVHQKSVEEADPTGEVPGKWAQEAGFVSNGAYTLSEWTHNESMVYVKNENFYDAENVTMNELHFMLSADDTAIYAAYNSGDLDYIDTVPNDEIASLNGKTDEFGILDNLGTYYIGFNVNDPIFDGKTVEQAADMRKAMSLLIDRKFIVDNVGQTGQIPADTFVPIGMADGNGGIFKTESEGSSYYDASATGAASVEEAKALLEGAGYSFTDNGNGTYAIEPAISITYLSNDGTGHLAAAQSIQQDLSTLGIEMEIKSEDWNVFIEDRKNGNFTLAREGWLADYNDPINMLEIFTSDSGNNDMQLGKEKSDSAPEWKAYDDLIASIRTTTDLGERAKKMHQAEDMLMETWAVIPLYYYNDVYMQKSNVEGIISTVYGMKYFMYATKK